MDQSGFRFKRISLFNNANKRQTSHLPYMEMRDHVVIHENNLVREGNSQEKVTLKMFRETNEHKSFRLFGEKTPET